ncbi:transglutaminase-like domain-containing protein [Phenylobacterium sp.]|uniref:transglutaminase-like domain-containing protein n=1 Tax=Phenylobacterium sp. TaxID=1871053 RepID=UPI002FE2012B
MRIRAGYEISYDCPGPTPMLLMLNVRPERQADLETADTVLPDPDLPVRQYLDAFGNVCSRVMAPGGRITFRADFVIRDSGEPDPADVEAEQHPVEDLPDSVIEYLLPSRYCDLELLSDLAWETFGSTPTGWARVQAIVDYAHERIRFGYEHARSTKTAHQAHEEGCGVCRDYAHLAITLCRSMNIPARYCTGYLGDIGVPPSGAPMDFSAWFEVFLGGRWRTFDARHNRPRIGRILMAVGRDATDVAITTHFGPATLSGFRVITEALS